MNSHTLNHPVDVLVSVTIQPTDYGKFFVVDSLGKVWNGAYWVSFGPAELYPSYGIAMKGRRAAIAKATGAQP